MSFLQHLFGRTVRAKQIPELTTFLVNNPMFRNLVLTFHKNKTDMINDMDSYLEK